jgi:hypothetical protein
MACVLPQGRRLMYGTTERARMVDAYRQSRSLVQASKDTGYARATTPQ